MNNLSSLYDEVYNAGDPMDDRYYQSSWSAYSYYPTSSGQIISPEQAMREATVFACTRVISDVVGMLPFVSYKHKSDGDKEQDLRSTLFDVLMIAPNQRQTPFEFKKFLTLSLIMRGYFLCKVIRRSHSGEIIGLEPCHPDYTTNGLTQSGELYWETALAKDVAINKAKKFKLKWEDAYYCPYATLDGVNPITPIAYNAETVGLAKEMREHGGNLFKNYAMPSGVLTTDKVLKPDGRKRVREAWQEAYGGGNRGRVAVLEEGATFKAITMSNTDAQYLESRQYTKEEICGIFGVPTHMISDTKRAKGWSTMEQAMREFLVMSAQPYFIRFEESAKRCLLPKRDWHKRSVQFDTTELTKADAETRTKRQLGYLDHGVLNPNEVRQEEGLNRRKDEGGDEYSGPGMNDTNNDESSDGKDDNDTQRGESNDE